MIKLLEVADKVADVLLCFVFQHIIHITFTDARILAVVAFEMSQPKVGPRMYVRGKHSSWKICHLTSRHMCIQRCGKTWIDGCVWLELISD